MSTAKELAKELTNHDDGDDAIISHQYVDEYARF